MRDSTAERPGEVWYDSPFGPPQWMARSQAERLLATEGQQFVRMREATGNTLLYAPRIVSRTERLEELRAEHSKEIDAIHAEIDRQNRKQVRPPKPKSRGRQFDWYVIDTRTNEIVNCVMAGERPKGVTDLMEDKEFLHLTKFPTKQQLDAYRYYTERV